MQSEPKRRDWIETTAKLLPGIAALIAGILIPLVIHIGSERNRSNQLYADIVSKREMADSDLRARMFEHLIKTFYGATPQTRSNMERLTLLRLLALNFHEFFALEPLFEQLEQERKLTPAERKKLREIAQEVVEKQEAMLSQIGEGMTFPKIVYPGRDNGTIVPAETEKAYRGHRLGITVTEMGTHDDSAMIHVEDIPEGSLSVGSIVKVDFKLNRYDAPFIDNTKLSGNVRFAVTFKGIVTDAEGKQAVAMRIIFFPESYMSSRDRPYLDEMLQHLTRSREATWYESLWTR
jgi:hypothetical protein